MSNLLLYLFKGLAIGVAMGILGWVFNIPLNIGLFVGAMANIVLAMSNVYNEESDIYEQI